MPVVTAEVGSIAIRFDVDVAIAAAVRRLAKSGTFYFVRSFSFGYRSDCFLRALDFCSFFVVQNFI